MKWTSLFLTAICIAVDIQVTQAQDRDIILPQRPERPAYKDYTTSDRGFWLAAEAEGGTSTFIDDNNMQVVGLCVNAGYRLSEFLRFGIGIGGRYYVGGNNKVRNTSVKWTIPVYVNARGNIISQYSRSMVPYWSVSVGGVLRDGVFVQPTLGLRFGELRDSWLLGLSYNLQHIDAMYARQETASSILLRVGYEF